MNADLLQGFYLGDLLVEPLKGEVTGRAGSRHLPPKAAEVLLCLARAPGDLVARESLLECAWRPGQGSHEALSHAISEIRLALDDHADDPVFIQTLPRLGYRLAVSPERPGEHATSVVIGAHVARQLRISGEVLPEIHRHQAYEERVQQSRPDASLCRGLRCSDRKPKGRRRTAAQ